MLGNRGPTDREIPSQFADGQRTIQQASQDRATSRIAKRVKLSLMVSFHLR
jgi:hypothetical protein